MEKRIKVAFAGQPNVGKSSLIYQIAGGDVQIGNWAGITTTKYTAEVEHRGYRIELVDLPGVYNLSPYTPEERVARDFLIFEKPDVVVNVLETPLLERNLFLTSQLLELEIPTVLALNMWDEFTSKGYRLDIETLERELGVSAVPVIGKTGWNKERLLDLIVEVYERKQKPKFFRFSPLIEEVLKKIWKTLEGKEFVSLFPKRWLQIKTLEGDEYLAKLLKERFNFNLLKCCSKERHYISEAFNAPPDEVIAEERYRAIARLVSKILKKPSEVKPSLQDRFDYQILNPFVGIPLFFLAMFLVFKLTFEVSTPLADWIDGFVNFLGKYIALLLEGWGFPPWFISLIKDGIVGGVGFFLTFIPPLVFMYLALGFLEHSGYFARVAFLTDRLLRPLGLTGKSVVPMILGFGCNVPALLATRTLESENLRKLTALLIPFMSCSARLPIYMLIALTFFPSQPEVVVFSMYLLGIAVALVVALLLKKRFVSTEIPFVIELPPYRLPGLKEILRSMWIPVWEFIHRAGTVILLANLAVWILINTPYGSPPEKTLLGKTATLIQPIFKPAGFGQHWENVAVLIPGFLAKELVVTSYATILGVEEQEKTASEKPQFWKELKEQLEGLLNAIRQSVKNLISPFLPSLWEVEKPPSPLKEKIKNLFNKASALAFIVFVLLYTPCAGTVAVLAQEFGFRFALFSVFLNLTVAWISSVATYWIFSLIL